MLQLSPMHQKEWNETVVISDFHSTPLKAVLGEILQKIVPIPARDPPPELAELVNQERELRLP